MIGMDEDTAPSIDVKVARSESTQLTSTAAFICSNRLANSSRSVLPVSPDPTTSSPSPNLSNLARESSHRLLTSSGTALKAARSKAIVYLLEATTYLPASDTFSVLAVWVVKVLLLYRNVASASATIAQQSITS